MEDVKKKKTFSGDVIARMMSDLEFEAFWQKYKASRKHTGAAGRDRFELERSQLTDKESKFIYEYLHTKDKSIKELGEQYGYTTKNTSSAVRKLAVQILWLNKEKLDF